MSQAADEGKCVHFQPADLTALAEKHLREAGVAETDWESRRFQWGGEIDSPPFNALLLQCVRRLGNWVITKIDRRKTGITPDEAGFKPL